MSMAGGAQHAFFVKHLKTHDQTFTMKYLGLELFLSSVIKSEEFTKCLFLATLRVGVMCKRKKIEWWGLLGLHFRVSLGLKLQTLHQNTF
jgi:hypothetical protein